MSRDELMILPGIDIETIHQDMKMIFEDLAYAIKNDRNATAEALMIHIMNSLKFIEEYNHDLAEEYLIEYEKVCYEADPIAFKRISNVSK
jgi:hypothetical protein